MTDDYTIKKIITTVVYLPYPQLIIFQYCQHNMQLVLMNTIPMHNKPPNVASQSELVAWMTTNGGGYSRHEAGECKNSTSQNQSNVQLDRMSLTPNLKPCSTLQHRNGMNHWPNCINNSTWPRCTATRSANSYYRTSNISCKWPYPETEKLRFAKFKS